MAEADASFGRGLCVRAWSMYLSSALCMHANGGRGRRFGDAYMGEGEVRIDI